MEEDEDEKILAFIDLCESKDERIPIPTSVRKCLQSKSPDLSLNNADISNHSESTRRELLFNMGIYIQQCPKQIINLCLASIPLSNSLMNTFTIALQKNNILRSFSLIDCCINDEGVLALSIGLQNNSTLTDLMLTNNQITSDGLESLGGVVEEGVLGVLGLAGNNITEFNVGLQFRKSRTLQKFIIGHNELTELAVFRMLDTFREGTMLEYLDLSGFKNYSEQIFNKFMEFLVYNKFLAHLKADIPFPNLSPQQMGQLGEVLMINTSLKLIETDVEEIVQSENYERIQMYMESNKWISQGVSLDYEQIPSDIQSIVKSKMEEIVNSSNNPSVSSSMGQILEEESFQSPRTDSKNNSSIGSYFMRHDSPPMTIIKEVSYEDYQDSDEEGFHQKYGGKKRGQYVMHLAPTQTNKCIEERINHSQNHRGNMLGEQSKIVVVEGANGLREREMQGVGVTSGVIVTSNPQITQNPAPTPIPQEPSSPSPSPLILLQESLSGEESARIENTQTSTELENKLTAILQDMKDGGYIESKESTASFPKGGHPGIMFPYGERGVLGSVSHRGAISSSRGTDTLLEGTCECDKMIGTIELLNIFEKMGHSRRLSETYNSQPSKINEIQPIIGTLVETITSLEKDIGCTFQTMAAQMKAISSDLGKQNMEINWVSDILSKYDEKIHGLEDRYFQSKLGGSFTASRELKSGGGDNLVIRQNANDVKIDQLTHLVEGLVNQQIKMQDRIVYLESNNGGSSGGHQLNTMIKRVENVEGEMKKTRTNMEVIRNNIQLREETRADSQSRIITEVDEPLGDQLSRDIETLKSKVETNTSFIRNKTTDRKFEDIKISFQELENSVGEMQQELKHCQNKVSQSLTTKFEETERLPTTMQSYEASLKEKMVKLYTLETDFSYIKNKIQRDGIFYDTQIKSSNERIESIEKLLKELHLAIKSFNANEAKLNEEHENDITTKINKFKDEINGINQQTIERISTFENNLLELYNIVEQNVNINETSEMSTMKDKMKEIETSTGTFTKSLSDLKKSISSVSGRLNVYINKNKETTQETKTGNVSDSKTVERMSHLEKAITDVQSQISKMPTLQKKMRNLEFEVNEQTKLNNLNIENLGLQLKNVELSKSLDNLELRGAGVTPKSGGGKIDSKKVEKDRKTQRTSTVGVKTESKMNINNTNNINNINTPGKENKENRAGRIYKGISTSAKKLTPEHNTQTDISHKPHNLEEESGLVPFNKFELSEIENRGNNDSSLHIQALEESVCVEEMQIEDPNVQMFTLRGGDNNIQGDNNIHNIHDIPGDNITNISTTEGRPRQLYLEHKLHDIRNCVISPKFPISQVDLSAVNSTPEKINKWGNKGFGREEYVQSVEPSMELVESLRQKGINFIPNINTSAKRNRNYLKISTMSEGNAPGYFEASPKDFNV